VHDIIVDVEATCWDGPRERDRDHMEIIEIGAVRLDEHLEILDEFDAFVRPVVEPTLSGFCTRLTSITQADVDDADLFSVAFPRFLDWIGDRAYRLCSWGFYDVAQFRLDCSRHGVAFPEPFETDHVNLKREFARRRGVPRCGMAEALAHLGLPLEGTHHRGIDDARNIARIARRLLPVVVQRRGSISSEAPAPPEDRRRET
jgi:3'-5' exoribonuclease 1